MINDVGPALVICPECGEEIGRDRVHTPRGTFLIPLPRTCPVCDAVLVPKVRKVDEHQAKLTGPAADPRRSRQVLYIDPGCGGCKHDWCMHDLKNAKGCQCRCLQGKPYYPNYYRCDGFEHDPRAFSDPVMVTGEKAVTLSNTQKMKV